MASEIRPLVLLVDDHDDTREIFAVLLRAHGFDIVAAANPDEALACALHTRPDVVLTDLFSQLHDPLAIIRRLRAEPALAAVAIVVMTGWAAEQHRIEALEQFGCAAYLTKPVAADILLAALKQALAQGQ
jgi:CheY-like chemotaxis protein